MIISHQYKFVYIDPPKTASATLDRLFQKYGGKFEFITPTQQKHRRTIPKEAEGYTKIASIRNPYDRLVSLYYFEQSRGMDKSFPDYIDFLLECTSAPDDDEDPGNFRYFPIVKFLSTVGEIDYFIRVESIEKDLEKLPFYTPQRLQQLHKINHPSFEDLAVSKELLDKINIWALPDCKEYGYGIWQRDYN